MKFYKGTEQQKADPKTACHKTQEVPFCNYYKCKGHTKKEY